MTSDSVNPTMRIPVWQIGPQGWYKPLIWGSLVGLLYLLHDFFLIGFLTFLICFGVRGLVGRVAGRIAPDRESRALEIVLTLAVFLAFCLVLYGLGRFFVPQLIRQCKSLVTQIKNTTAEDLQNSLLSHTVGAWQFHQQYGTAQDPRYQSGLKEFQQSGQKGQGLYQSFPQIELGVRAQFEANYEDAQVLHLKSPEAGANDSRFDQWFLHVKAPELFGKQSDYYILRWQADYSTPEKLDELTVLKQRPDFESIRDKQIRQQILNDVKSDPVLLAELKNQWARTQSLRQWDEFRKSEKYHTEFKKFYKARREENPAAIPLDFDFFQSLASAYPQGKQAFLDVVDQHYKEDAQSLASQQHDFEAATKLELGQQWWATSHVADWVRENAKNDGPKVLDSLIHSVDRGLGHLVRVPIQIVTALVLAIFILIEWHSLKSGIASLRNTRLRPLYDEIVPGFVALGKLIGKSFQGQVLIAFFNGLLTLAALSLIGVDYKFILTLIVFVFSFIPVVGVILSSFPLCLVAILQPGGSLLKAVQVIGAIIVIHLIEGTILSPRIIGKIGHLHPVLVIGILMVAEHFFGMWGLILGVPVAIYVIRVVILNAPIPGVYQPTEPAT